MTPGSASKSAVQTLEDDSIRVARSHDKAHAVESSHQVMVADNGNTFTSFDDDEEEAVMTNNMADEEQPVATRAAQSAASPSSVTPLEAPPSTPEETSSPSTTANGATSMLTAETSKVEAALPGQHDADEDDELEVVGVKPSSTGVSLATLAAAVGVPTTTTPAAALPTSPMAKHSLGAMAVAMKKPPLVHPASAHTAASAPLAPTHSMDPNNGQPSQQSSAATPSDFNQITNEALQQSELKDPPSQSSQVIDLVDDDENESPENLIREESPLDEEMGGGNDEDAAGLIEEVSESEFENQKRQKLNNGSVAAPAERTDHGHRRRTSHLPDWMAQAASEVERTIGTPVVPGASLFDAVNHLNSVASAAYGSGQTNHGYASVPPPASQAPNPLLQPPATSTYSAPASAAPYLPHGIDSPEYLDLPAGFTPTWKLMLPTQPRHEPAASQPNRSQQKYFELSLLNVNEFTITGLATRFEGPPTPVTGLRGVIKQISRDHGKAVYERDKEGGGGKWRIPLGAYHAFYTYLTSDSFCRVNGISQTQLQIASLERARQEKGYPSTGKVMEMGVPAGLAKALAPFQRGGVDFVVEKGGRALIADDMGLGKTIQGIASMSVYYQDWPLLVLCPSSARYHWEIEFQNWLGKDSTVNKSNDEEADPYDHPCLLLDHQINVLTSSKVDLFPTKDTKVVICSYGLAPALVESGKIWPGLFPCAIVDESHMLKNKATKRTASLVPILNATKQCVLLSGTPAFAKPSELWPQLEILRTSDRHNWWADEADFMQKYAKNGGKRERAELHTMLTGTVMIRRLKNDILKQLPKKSRSKAVLHVLTQDQRLEFKHLLVELRKSKGALGKLARAHYAEAKADEDGDHFEAEAGVAVLTAPGQNGATNTAADAQRTAAHEQLRTEIGQQFETGRARIHQSLAASAHELTDEHRQHIAFELEGELRMDLERRYHERSVQIDSHHQQSVMAEQENKRTTLLSRLYGLTGDAKIPLIVDMLKRWLQDPTKGKLCIFAHHISVLDALLEQAGLSNDEGSRSKFIRIDGSTIPKRRQEQIKAFQTDPSVRIALLGITAAGVAVTLTASSTVWFAELFWTPAIMIQAEDRCHRIGQQAAVQCLYFVAKGTLDEVLWKLIEKKFQDLGEFVEGKEKQKIVVDKTYTTLKDLHSMFETFDAEGEEDEDMYDDETGISQELKLDSELFHDIEELGEEERRMLRLSESDEEDGEGSSSSEERKVMEIDAGPADGLGRSEQEAILLSDSEDEEDAKPAATKPPADTSSEGHEAMLSSATESPMHRSASFADKGSLYGVRYFNVRISGPTLGLEVSLVRDRVMVSKVTEERAGRLGPNSKPSFGDMLVAINGYSVPHAMQFPSIVQAIRDGLRNPPIGLTFAEHPSFSIELQKYLDDRARKREERNKAAADNVIDLIDDE